MAIGKKFSLKGYFNKIVQGWKGDREKGKIREGKEKGREKFK